MGNVICSLRRRLFAVLALTVLLVGVLLADVFVDLTVDPPEVLEDWPCVSDCRRDASGISFAIDDASCDLAFTFLGLPEDAEVCYLLHAGGQVVSSGYGTALPLADHPDADRVEFFSPDGSTDWGAVTSVRAERAELRPSGRAPYASAAAASADGSRLAEDRPGLAAGPRATHVVDGARAGSARPSSPSRTPIRASPTISSGNRRRAAPSGAARTGSIPSTSRILIPPPTRTSSSASGRRAATR